MANVWPPYNLYGLPLSLSAEYTLMTTASSGNKVTHALFGFCLVLWFNFCKIIAKHCTMVEIFITSKISIQ